MKPKWFSTEEWYGTKHVLRHNGDVGEVIAEEGRYAVTFWDGTNSKDLGFATTLDGAKRLVEGRMNV